MAHAIKPTGKKAKKSDAKTEVKTMAMPSKKGAKVRKHHGDLGVPSYKEVKKAAVVAPVRQPSKKVTPKVTYDEVALVDLCPPAFTLEVICLKRASVTIKFTCAATGGTTIRTVRKDRVPRDLLLKAWTKV